MIGISYQNPDLFVILSGNDHLPPLREPAGETNREFGKNSHNAFSEAVKSGNVNRNLAIEGLVVRGIPLQGTAEVSSPMKKRSLTLRITAGTLHR